MEDTTNQIWEACLKHRFLEFRQTWEAVETWMALSDVFQTLVSSAKGYRRSRPLVWKVRYFFLCSLMFLPINFVDHRRYFKFWWSSCKGAQQVVVFVPFTCCRGAWTEKHSHSPAITSWFCRRIFSSSKQIGTCPFSHIRVRSVAWHSTCVQSLRTINDVPPPDPTTHKPTSSVA